MEKPFSKQLYDIANSMGIGLYQRFSVVDASLFLRCPVSEIEKLKTKIGFVQINSGEIEFFGYQLLEYLLSNIQGGIKPAEEIPSTERIIRSQEVQKLTSLSRTSIWRLEKSGDFPARVGLCAGSVGWRYSEVEEWIRTRK